MRRTLLALLLLWGAAEFVSASPTPQMNLPVIGPVGPTGSVGPTGPTGPTSHGHCTLDGGTGAGECQATVTGSCIDPTCAYTCAGGVCPSLSAVQPLECFADGGVVWILGAATGTQPVAWACQ